MKHTCIPNRLLAARVAINHQGFSAGQHGVSLVELLVAMAISAIIAIAAVSALIISRQGFSTVDAASQIRDNARFATDLIQRIGVQSGFQDVKYAATNRAIANAGLATLPPPNVSGATNSVPVTDDATFTTFTTKATGAAGFGSDVLVLRYQTVETFPGSGVTDKTMIDCMGTASAAIATDQDDSRTSVFYVDDSLGEPSLMCRTDTGGTPQPIVRGVEKFQVLYGVSGVAPGLAPTAAFTAIPDRYLRADQMTVAGSPVNTNANWSRVRSIRIGMVLRGPPGSAQEMSDPNHKLYPFGMAPNAAGGTPGSALSSESDPGTIFTNPSDSRLRQTVSFTVHLRNAIDH